MAQANPVIATEALARGLRTEFLETYRRKIKDTNAKLPLVMDLGVPSDKLTELYFYWLSAPHPRRWPRGEEIASKPFDGASFTVTNYDWGIKVPWHANDEEDDQSRSLVQQVREAATGFAILPERAFFQLLTNATDAELLPAVPNAPDGAAFFATTAGGANRFGVSSGNLLTGTGVATAAAIRTDFYNAIEQFRLFQDTEGQPLWDEAIFDRGYVIVGGAANSQIFAEAFAQRTSLQIVQNVAATENVAAAGLSNVIMDAGHRIQLWLTPRITDNDWFVFLEGSAQKAVFQQVRQPLRDNVEDFANSDFTRRTKIKALQFDARAGFGLTLPYQAIQVNN